MQAARAVTQVMGGVRLRNALADVDDGTALRGRSLVQSSVRHVAALGNADDAGALVRKPIADPLLRSLVPLRSTSSITRGRRHSPSSTVQCSQQASSGAPRHSSVRCCGVT